jgi:hypothetical protein
MWLAAPRPHSGDGLDPGSDSVLIPFVEPRGLVKRFVGQRIGIRDRALKASASSRNQRGPKIVESVVTATAMNDIGSAPQFLSIIMSNKCAKSFASFLDNIPISACNTSHF